MNLNRRHFLTQASLLTAGALLPKIAFGQAQKIRVGLMLPYTGTFAQLGVAITNGFKLAVSERGGKLGGRELEYFTVDDEADPSKAPENTNKLVQRDKVDVLVGTVHSGVQMGMVKIAKENNTLMIIPNAGLDAATGALCSPNIFRTSFSNWQPSYPMGKVLADRGIRNVVSLAWKYGAGEEAIGGFTEGFIKAGGKTVRGLWIPFPNAEFQALLTEIASIKPDAVFVFFAGAGAAKLIKDYAAAGLRKTIPLYGSGFLTDGVLDAVDNAAEGLETTLHYADGLNTKRDREFRAAYRKAYTSEPDVYAVQGFDAGLLLAAGVEGVKGDITKRKELIAAMEKAKIDSPRGAWIMSKAHNPIQDIYLRKVVGKENRFVSIAHKALADPARGCKL
ncbi:MAG: branched-chain amino acid transporter system, substrate-binding protein [Deltaproteobacteria bacterium]|nr:branched-chain amino acid transporter system, substrate-binding protein [Deltaproteobacteria bacterium]